MAVEPSALATTLAREEEKILACVHCGLCLEACPTYVITGDENDSPRGRIYLMRAVKEKRLAVDSLTFETHIDRCLGCRACESACPAGVEYGHLLEAARAEIAHSQTKPTGLYRLLYFALKHVWLKPKRLRGAFTFARLLRESGVPRFLIRAGVARGISPQLEFALALLDGSSGGKTAGGKSAYRAPEVGKSRPASKVLLFRGCVTEGLFKRINEATERVLKVNGSNPKAPEAQVCCGALHAHAGDLEGARELARQNIDAFADGDAPIISNAGGCGAMLVSYAHLLADDEAYAQKAKEFTSRVRDIGQHLEADGFRNGAYIGSTRTTYDASCHLLHGQHGAEASLKMLWAIPDLNFSSLKDSDVCCGGAGVYNLMEPELSDEVLTAKLDHIKQSGAEVVATGNPGCHMQIAAGARVDGMSVKVCHPVELLDESYRRAGFYE
jgi:glycolate oxidase iron-sulfur subunit